MLKNKKKFIVIGILSGILVFSSIFAASSSYNYLMRHRVVRGNKNGQFHYLDSGRAYIQGSGWIQQGGHADPTYYVNFTLVKDGVFKKTIGTVRGDKYGNVSGYFPKVEKGKYYLEIWTREKDYCIRSGYGKVYNK